MFFQSSKFKTTTYPRNLWTRVTSIIWCCLGGSTLPPVCLRRLFLTFLGFSRCELSSKKLFVSEGNSFCLFHSLLSGGHGGRIWCICIGRRGILLGSVRYYYCTDYDLDSILFWFEQYGGVAKRCQLWVCTIDWWKRNKFWKRSRNTDLCHLL